MDFFCLKLALLGGAAILGVCGAEPKKYNTPIINYRCISAESKCIQRQSFVLEAVTKYNLAFLSQYTMKLACTEIKTGEKCVKEEGCRKELAGQIKLMKWICRHRRELFQGMKCWRSKQFRENAPKCDEKIQKKCHYHKLVGTCLKTVIGKNRSCKPKQMHFYGGLLEAIDKMRNPNGRCAYEKDIYGKYY